MNSTENTPQVAGYAMAGIPAIGMRYGGVIQTQG